MKKRKEVVRVVLHDDMSPQLYQFIEQLRYANLVKVHRNDQTGMCFDLIPPSNVNEPVWCKQNAERMVSFGYNAVVAPATP